VHVAALGTSLLKGAAQQHPGELELLAHGPVGDRRFCCVDPVAARVLRTVENPRLLQLRARLRHDPGGPEVLVLDVPGHGRLEAPVEPADGAAVLRADYWGRVRDVDLLAGPWAAPLSAHLGREVVLTRARPRDVVYGGGVTLVTTSSLGELARRAGGPTATAGLVADAERWRATLVVDSGDAPPFVEDSWVGRTLQVGSTRLDVMAGVPRCAVVRYAPGDGRREGWDPLALLAPDRLHRQEVVFGVQAEVLVPGRVRVRDPVGAG